MTIEKCYKCLGDIAEAQAAQHGLHEKCCNEWFGLITTEDFSNIIVRSSSSGNKKKTDEQFRKNSSFFHGKFNLTSTNIVDFEGIYFRNPLVSLHVDSQKCFVVTE